MGDVSGHMGPLRKADRRVVLHLAEYRGEWVGVVFDDPVSQPGRPIEAGDLSDLLAKAEEVLR